METLLILTYAAICVAVFKLFKIPLTKWTVPTAVLGCVVIIGTLVFVMNYNHPYSEVTRKYAWTTPIVPTVSGRVIEVPVTPNQRLSQGDLLFRIDPQPFQDKLNSLTAQLKAAELDLERAEQLLARSAISRRDVDLTRAKAEDLRAQTALAQFNLDETLVRAPTPGYVTQMMLRPGMMAVNLPLRPVMVFVHQEADVVVGWFRQNSLLRLSVGDEAEVAFDGLPGQVFSGEVVTVAPALAEGQLQPSGNLQRESFPAGRVPVRIEITDPEFEAYKHQVPSGAYGQSAIYSEHAHHVAIMRKILLRMSAWMNYLFPFH